MEVPYAQGGVTNGENLMIRKPLQIGLAEVQTATVEDGGYVVLDSA